MAVQRQLFGPPAEAPSVSGGREPRSVPIVPVGQCTCCPPGTIPQPLELDGHCRLCKTGRGLSGKDDLCVGCLRLLAECEALTFRARRRQEDQNG